MPDISLPYLAKMIPWDVLRGAGVLEWPITAVFGLILIWCTCYTILIITDGRSRVAFLGVTWCVTLFVVWYLSVQMWRISARPYMATCAERTVVDPDTFVCYERVHVTIRNGLIASKKIVAN